MNKSFQNTSQSSDRNSNGVNGNVSKVQTKSVTMAEKLKQQIWFPISQLPTDLIVRVQDINFYVHKLPLISKSEYLNQLDIQSQSSNCGYDIKLENFPGGAETFEIILKFSYGFPIDLTATNVAPVRCAAEYLQMTEECEKGNLISEAEAFLTLLVLSSWKDSITVLKSCESLSPWAENLHIVRACSDSIATKISTRKSTCNGTHNDERWWFNDVSILHIDHFARIVMAIRARGLKPDTIGACIMHYTHKWLPSMEIEIESQRGYGCGKNEFHMHISSGKWDEGNLGQNKEQRRMIELLVSILPSEREAVSCKFLLWMLKMALVYSATPALASKLEKKVGMVLEAATVNDLLIPSNNQTEEQVGRSPYGESTMYEVNVVQRIVEYYLTHDQQQQQMFGKLDVGKLLDGYLSEVAKDPNLSIFKFQALAEALPQTARTCHDGLYRAIDTYLKTHPTLLEHNRRRLCKTMDCEKLSLDACMHAAQNDRLPLRTVMQVMFTEQVKMRAAMEEKEQMQREIISDKDSNWSTKKEIKSIILELEKIRTMIAELQTDYSELQQEIEKLNKQKSVSRWNSGWKRFKNTPLFHGKINDTDRRGHAEQTTPSSKNGRRRRRSYS